MYEISSGCKEKWYQNSNFESSDQFLWTIVKFFKSMFLICFKYYIQRNKNQLMTNAYGSNLNMNIKGYNLKLKLYKIKNTDILKFYYSF